MDMKIKTYPIKKRQKILNGQILEVCKSFKNGVSVIKLAETYNVTRGAIYAILKNNKIDKRKYCV